MQVSLPGLLLFCCAIIFASWDTCPASCAAGSPPGILDPSIPFQEGLVGDFEGCDTNLAAIPLDIFKSLLALAQHFEISQEVLRACGVYFEVMEGYCKSENVYIIFVFLLLHWSI